MCAQRHISLDFSLHVVPKNDREHEQSRRIIASIQQYMYARTPDVKIHDSHEKNMLVLVLSIKVRTEFA